MTGLTFRDEKSHMSRQTDIRDAFFDELYEIAREDDSVIFMTADMGAFSLERFRRDFPDRYINVGIAEQNMVSVAAGMAMEGKKVFIYAIIPFVTLRCLEQIKVDLCVMNLPVTIVGAGAGFTYSSDGPTHHAIEDVSVMRALPGMTIYSPSDQVTAQAAVRAAHQARGPVYVRLDKGSWPLAQKEWEQLTDSFSLLRSGSKLLIIATGHMTHVAVQVAESLRARGLDPGVMELFRLKPIDGKIVDIVREYAQVITLEEHTLPGGMGSAVLETLADSGVMVPVKRFGIPDRYPHTYGDREWLTGSVGLNVPFLSARIEQEMKHPAQTGAREPDRPRWSEGGRHSLTPDDFARLLGVPSDEFSKEIVEYIETTDFSFRTLCGDEREELLLQIISTIDSGTLSVSGPHKQVVWERGWGENLSDFERSGHDPKALLPRFVRKGRVMRLQGSFIMPSNPDFETSMVRVMRDVLFRKYFSGTRAVFEFGCGTGLNLLHLAALFPEKRLFGLDWAQASCDIVNRLSETEGVALQGILFDMYAPDRGLDLTPADGVLTIGALEQLGARFDSFLSFLLSKSPGICIHLETMDEIYTEPTLTDYLTKRYSRTRNYLDGYLTALRELERSGRAEILQVQRTFGTQFHEGYSFVAWRPIPGNGQDIAGSEETP